jgi:sec-independent protein translocase protein TatA
MRLGMGEILIILVVALLIFGPTKLPQLGDALGKAIKNFKKGSLEPDEPEPPKPAPQLSQGNPATPATPAQPPAETSRRA